MKTIVIGAILSVYFYLVYLFYVAEKENLLKAYLAQRDLYMERGETNAEFEVAVLLAVTAFMLLGYIGGIRKAIFIMFLYKVPLEILKKEYADYMEAGSANIVTVGLGTFLTVIGLMELLDYGSGKRKV